VEKSERYEEARRLSGVLDPSDFNLNVGNRANGMPSNLARQRLADGSEFTTAEYTTTGWTDCDCEPCHHRRTTYNETDGTLYCEQCQSWVVPEDSKWRNGHVLDPFAGSGTTIAVAHGCGRDATGIELYQANADLIADRLGLFLEVVA
jgi:ribosomal protein S27E